MVVSFFAFLKCLAGMLPQHTPHFICAFLLSCFPSPWTGKAVGHRSRVLLALAECLAHLMSHGGGAGGEYKPAAARVSSPKLPALSWVPKRKVRHFGMGKMHLLLIYVI